MARPRDAQRSRAWQATYAARHRENPRHVAVLQEFADEITRSRWWGGRQPKIRKVYVTKKAIRSCVPIEQSILLPKKRGKGTEPRDVIAVDPEGYTKADLLHCLAHLLTAKGTEWHGTEWAAAYLAITKRFMGPDEATALRDDFRAAGVKTYHWSEEAKKKAAERAEDRRFEAAGEGLRRLEAMLSEDE